MILVRKQLNYDEVSKLRNNLEVEDAIIELGKVKSPIVVLNIGNTGSSNVNDI